MEVLQLRTMTTASRRSRYPHSSAPALDMLAGGESGQVEFKRELKSVSPSLLAALANAVALDPARRVAHLLVGVDERKDDETGVVTGVPFGLPRGLEHAVEVILNVAKETRPTPVEVFVVEEATQEQIPFVRVEIQPTTPPHYDGEGRRQTRPGRTTRALTDDELLRIYLDREAGTFSQRFRQTSEELHAAVGGIGSQVEGISDAIQVSIAEPIARLEATTVRAATAAQVAASSADAAEDAATTAASAASSAESTAADVAFDLTRVQRLTDELYTLVEDLHDETPASMGHRIVQQRRHVWLTLAVDTWDRSSTQAEKVANQVRDVLTTDVSIDDRRNTWEVMMWHDLLRDREQHLHRGRGTLKWWREALSRLSEFAKEPVYQAPDLPDLRAEMRADLDYALSAPDSETNRFQTLIDS